MTTLSYREVAAKAVQQPVVEHDVPPVVPPIERDRDRGGFEMG